MSDYPEHDRLAAVSGETQVVGEFLTWLAAQGYVIARWTPVRRDERLMPISESIETLLAEWKDIDRHEIDREKRAMIEKLAAMNAPAVTP